ncbi:hypothetical protein JCM11251_003317 [Rhodosporidiobolus azoricus]
MAGLNMTMPITTAITFGMEDQTGRTEVITIYNYHLHGVKTGADLDALFPLGQVLAIREPSARPDPYGGGTAIMVDSPSDFLFLQPNDPLLVGVKWAFPSPIKPLPASFDYKAHGNSLFKAKKYHLAVKAYTDGLAFAETNEQKLLLHLNRAQAHLYLDNFASARRDSSLVLAFLALDTAAPPEAKLKATLRRARGIEGMELLPAASEAYDKVLEVEPTSEEGERGKARVGKMLEQARTGTFDLLKLTRAEDALGEKTVYRANAVGEFLGPIKVVELGGRGGGRGIVATRDIAGGELLLVEKAFALSSPVEEGDTLTISYNPIKSQINRSTSSLLAKNVAARIMDDPSTKPIIDSLYGGAEYPPIAAAVLGAMSSRDIGTNQTADVDIARIKAVAVQNAFGVRGPSVETHFGSNGPSALFPSASLFNHSCMPNAVHSTYGDVFFVRARKAMKQGDELKIPYTTTSDTLEMRNRVFLQHFGRSCDCEPCEADRLDGTQNLQRRQALPTEKLVHFYRAFRNLDRSQITHHALETIYKGLLPVTAEMEGTYTTSRTERPDLVGFYVLLAELCFPSVDCCLKGTEYTLKALEAAGAPVEVERDEEGLKQVKVLALPFSHISDGVRMLLNVAYALLHCRNSKKAAESELWVDAAKELARMDKGGLEDFDSRFRRGRSLLGRSRSSRWRASLSSSS